MAEIAKRVRGEEAWSKRPTHRGSSSGQPNREQRQRRLVSVVAMVARDGLNRWRIGRGAGRSACRAALWGPIPRFRGRSRPDSAAGSPARAIPDAALPRSGELRLGSQQVREAEQQRETLAVLLKTRTSYPCFLRPQSCSSSPWDGKT